MMCVSVNLRISQLCANLYLYCDTHKLFRFFSLANKQEEAGGAVLLLAAINGQKKRIVFFLLVTFSEKK